MISISKMIILRQDETAQGHRVVNGRDSSNAGSLVPVVVLIALDITVPPPAM